MQISSILVIKKRFFLKIIFIDQEANVLDSLLIHL